MRLEIWEWESLTAAGDKISPSAPQAAACSIPALFGDASQTGTCVSHMQVEPFYIHAPILHML